MLVWNLNGVLKVCVENRVWRYKKSNQADSGSRSKSHKPHPVLVRVHGSELMFSPVHKCQAYLVLLQIVEYDLDDVLPLNYVEHSVYWE